MNRAMYAVMKKDFRGIISNRRLFLELLIVPMILTIVLPSIFVVAIHFAPDDPDILKMLELLPQGSRTGGVEMAVTGLILNYILPVFFLMIPIMTASIMAASSFVGEKEKHTLETLLYCPLSVKQIFQAKVLASFLFSMMVALISFAAMMIVLEMEAFFIMDRLIMPAAGWIVILCLLSPSISLITVTRIPAGCGFPYRSADSARCRSVRGSHAAECMDTAGTGSAVCSAGMDAAAQGGWKVYL